MGRFFPAIEVTGEGSTMDARLSGERALKTDTGLLLSGVFGLGSDEGTETTRVDELRAMGVESLCAGMTGICGMDERVLDLSRDGPASISGLAFVVGFAALAATSFVCRFWTLRLNDSTFAVSFLFSLSILGRGRF